MPGTAETENFNNAVSYTTGSGLLLLKAPPSFAFPSTGPP